MGLWGRALAMGDGDEGRIRDFVHGITKNRRDLNTDKGVVKDSNVSCNIKLQNSSVSHFEKEERERERTDLIKAHPTPKINTQINQPRNIISHTLNQLPRIRTPRQ